VAPVLHRCSSVEPTAPRTLILGTAGHIDHGKTSLVRALTGIDTDRLPEEKARGITIDIGFAHLDLPGARVGIVDVPGHERFIRNMLAGATGIDVAMLVVAADDSIMPQTREHLAILDLLGIRHGLIALTKCDLCEESWLDLVEQDVRELAAGTLLDEAPIVRTSAATGHGLDDVKRALGQIAKRVTNEGEGDAFRMSIDRSFVAQGVGTVVTGTVASGTLRAGDEVELSPAGKRVRVRGVQSHGREAVQVSRGQRAAVNVMGLHHTEIERGDEIAAPGFLVPSRLMNVHLRVLRDSPWPLRHRARVRLHVGTREAMASVRLLESNEIEPGGEGFAQLILARPATAAGGQAFVIRAESPLVTLGGGHVLTPAAARMRRRDDEAIEHLARLRSPAAAERCAAAIRAFGLRRWTALDLHRDAGVALAPVPEMIESLRAKGEIVELAGPRGAALPVLRTTLDDIAGRVTRELSRLHEASPLESHVPRRRVLECLAWMHADDAMEGAIEWMIAQRRITSRADGIALATFKPLLTEAQRHVAAKVEQVYREARFMPPDLGELAAKLGESEKSLRPVLDLLVRAGRLAHLGGPLYMDASHEADLRRLVRERLHATSSLAVSEIRDLLGTSRKYATPMCEHLDRVGLTKRVGDQRVLREAVVPSDTIVHRGR
jgi:selenocysteine-specific elongation factor